MEYLAHISEDGLRKHSLGDHLLGTAALAKSFGAPFQAGEVAYLAGLFHDLGKVQKDFQKRLRGSSVQCDHSTPSAIYAKNRILASDKKLISEATAVAMCIAGHHTGLLDYGSGTDDSSQPTFIGRLKRSEKIEDSHLRKVFKEVPKLSWKSFNRTFHASSYVERWQFSSFIRMIFSCLVDADFLDTERFMRGDVGRKHKLSLSVLDHRLDQYMTALTSTADKTKLNKVRAQILNECRNSAEIIPGLFNLTVPTGGAKTLSSLSFALKHARKHDLHRIIYVIPYTSIIDQTVKVFEQVFGDHTVLAHHANVDFDPGEFEANDQRTQQLKLAAENWDYPIIVTTAVQFFESFYAARTSRCRKLHNMTESVIIFDEAQILPIHYLRLCLAAVLELTSHYGSSAVFCTATQPELEKLAKNDAFLSQLLGERSFNNLVSPEIMNNPCFNRVTYRNAEMLSKEELVKELMSKKQVLCIVNTKGFGSQLYQELMTIKDKIEGLYFLSTWLTPYDREIVLEEIKGRLQAKLPCCVISTSLVEAGVDIDFPEVFREITGLSSVVQSAGRCNREGKRDHKTSILTVFEVEGNARPLQFKQDIYAMLETFKKTGSFASKDSIEEYYKILYGLRQATDATKVLEQSAFDQKLILKDLTDLNLRTAAAKFQLIETMQTPIYIELLDDDGNTLNGELLSQLKKGQIQRSLIRQLSRYAVQLYPHELRYLLDLRAVDMFSLGDEQFYILWRENQYDRKRGLIIDHSVHHDSFERGVNNIISIRRGDLTGIFYHGCLDILKLVLIINYIEDRKEYKLMNLLLKGGDNGIQG